MKDFNTWLEECRYLARDKGTPIPTSLDDAGEFFWKNQYENHMEPSEAVYYFQQTQGENNG